MPTFREGDRVRVVTRAQTDDDIKSAMYFPHYGGMTGTVAKVYSKNEVSVEVDAESLSKEIRKRHDDVRDQMKTKWLDGLSEEGRSKLTEREKDFNLRYMVLVGMGDLEKAGPRAVSAFAKEPAATTAGKHAEEPAPARKTSADLEAAEEAELRRRRGA